MAFKAGSIVVDAKLNDSDFKKGASGLKTAAAGAGKAILALGAAAGVALVAGLTKSTKTANEFQIEMANVNTIVDESAINTQALAAEILQLDPALGDATEITRGFYQAFSAGAPDAEAAMDIVTEAAMFAKAAVTDASTSVDILTTAVNAYGAENMTAKQASDLFFTTIKDGKINGEQLSAVIGQSIPLFASAGIEMQELTAGIAAMTKQGVSASESTTQLNGIVNAFLKPTADLTKLLEDQGYASGAALLESEGLAGALKLVEEATGGNAAEMGKLLPNIRAMQGAMALTGVGGEEFSSILDDMANSAGATEQAFAEQEITFETLKNSLTNAQVVVGNIAKHFADDLAGGATEATQAFISFVMSTQGAELAGEIIGRLVGTFETLKEGLVFLKDNVLGTFKEQWEDVSSALDDFKGEAGEAFTATDLFGGVLQFVSSALKITGVAIGGVIENVVNFVTVINKAGGTVGSFFEMLKGEASWQEVKDNAKDTGEALEEFAKDGIGNIKDLVTTVTEEFSTYAEGAEAASIRLETAWEESYTNTKNNVMDTYMEMLTGQEEFSEELLDKSAELAENLAEQQEEANDDALDTLEDHDQDMLDEAAAFMTQFETDEQLSLDQRKAQLDIYYAQGIIDYTTYKDALAQIRIQKEAQELAEDEAHRKKMGEQYQFYADLTLGMVNSFTNLGSVALATYYDKEMQAAIEAAGGIENLTDQERSKLNAKAKKQWEDQRDYKSSMLWINFAAGTAGVWANAMTTYEPITGAVIAGVMTAALLAETIAADVEMYSQQFVEPYAMGGTVSGSMMQQINEQGGELVKLPDGTVVVPNDLSRDIMGGGANNIHIVINSPIVDSERRLKEMTKEIERRLIKRL